MSATGEPAVPQPAGLRELPTAPPRRRIRLTPVGWIALAIVLAWLAVCFIGPAISPYSEADMVSDVSFGAAGTVCPPGETEGCTFHLLGTDYIGRDILSRILYGARNTIGIAFLATLLAYLVGVTLGIAAAVGGPRVDMVLSRLTDVLMSIPSIMKGLVVIAAVGSSIPVLIVTAGITYSSPVFRIARALAMDVAVNDFVEVARARGERLAWIIRRELLPNIVMPLATDFGVRLVYIVLFIASLSFLGLGVQPPTADWGGMVRENLQGLVYGSLAPIAPAVAIATLTISINLIVDDISASSGGRLAARMI